MKGLLVLSVICMEFYSSYGNPVSSGGGAYSYQDSHGKRYGGTYELKDGQVTGFKGDDFPIHNFIPNFDFFPPNFMNFGNFHPQLNPFLGNPAVFGTPGFGSMMSGFGMPGTGGFGMPNFAASGASIGPGFVHQFAGINPTNPAMPNIDIVNRFAEVPDADKGGNYHSVSSSSYSSFSNLNGQGSGKHGAETVVNDNGKITKYSVHSP